MKDSPVTWLLKIDAAVRRPHGLRDLLAASPAAHPWLRWIASSLGRRTCGALEEAIEDRDLSESTDLAQRELQTNQVTLRLYLNGPRGEQVGYEFSSTGSQTFSITELGRYELVTADGAIIWSADLTAVWHILRDEDFPPPQQGTTPYTSPDEPWRLAAAPESPPPPEVSSVSESSSQYKDGVGRWTVPYWGVHVRVRRNGEQRLLEVTSTMEPTP